MNDSISRFVMLPEIESYRVKDNWVHLGDNLHIGNGDPVIVHSNETGAVSLGTGMSCTEDVVRETVRKVGVVEEEQFRIFLPAGGMHFDNVT